MPTDLRSAAARHLVTTPEDLTSGTPAAVLIPILDGEGPSIFFTLRTEALRHHSGEISFPGGRRHSEDADLRATALRETHEELGLPPEAVDVLGALPPIQARVSGFNVIPFVGLLAERPEFVPSPEEVAEIVEVPLRTLLAIEQEREWQVGEDRFKTYAYEYEGHTIWGATGRMLKTFLDTLRREGWE
ncbi:MAG: CoA pyrophosphatase [Actinobacteria bacterium]|nr:CoA pyrophosphatase [Actinomycetota bacterium]